MMGGDLRYHFGFITVMVAGSVLGASESIPFDSPRWEISAEESRVEEYMGRKSLYLKGGLALIEDAANREEFYIRPHQSGNPDANQYTPVFNGLTACSTAGTTATVRGTTGTWEPSAISMLLPWR
jgi:hypothetical protein